MGCSASSAAVMHQSDVTASSKHCLSSENNMSSLATNITKDKQKEKQKSSKGKYPPVVAQTSTTHIKLSTKTPKEYITPDRRPLVVATSQGSGQSVQSRSSQEVPLTSEQTLLRHGKNSLIAQKRRADKIIEEAAVDMPFNTKTPREQLPPINKEQSMKKSESNSSLKMPTEDGFSKSRNESLGSLKSMEFNSIENRSLPVTQTTKDEPSDPVDSGKPDETKDSEDKDSAAINKNTSKEISKPDISLVSSSPAKEELGAQMQTAESSTSPLPTTTGEVTLTSTDKTHEAKARAKSPNNGKRKSGPFEKSLKITSKDEKTQFVVTAAKDRSRSKEHTNSILIQTDVISIDDKNEKTKRKLLIKMKKLGSKSGPSIAHPPKLNAKYPSKRRHERKIKKDSTRLKEKEEEEDVNEDEEKEMDDTGKGNNCVFVVWLYEFS